MPNLSLQRENSQRRGQPGSPTSRRKREGGQALIEYVLILALVAVALIAVLTITGPAVGNVFSNAVYSVLGDEHATPRDTLSAGQFWNMVAAVASYTPEPIDVVRTNTPPPNISDADGDGIPDLDDDCPTQPGPLSMIPGQNGCPPPDADGDGVPDMSDDCPNVAGPVSNQGCPLTDTDGDGVPDINDDCPLVHGEPAYNGCPPPTPGPSPTPPDQSFGYPFDDKAENKDLWQHDFDQETLKDWEAEFWDLPGSDGASYASDMSSMPEGSGVWTTSYDTLDYYWPDSPGGGVYRNFYARYKTSVTLEPVEYTLHVRVDDGIRVWIGGNLVVDRWYWVNNAWFTQTFTATAGVNEVVVEHYDNHTNAYIGVWLESSGNPNIDQGDCNWTLVGEQYHSAPLAWSDSPGTNTASNSYCILKLRGNIDLTGASAPKLEFWDRYDLAAISYAKVGVSVSGSGTWDDYVLHANGTNLAWARYTLDLANFGDSGNDYRNQVIEIRFVIDARDAATPGDGWWIDDIKVEENDPNVYQLGFADDMEGALYWVAGGTWQRSSEQRHRGASAWSDSPGADYANNSTNILQLDGVIDLSTGPGNPEVTDPEITFWHRYNLTNTDVIRAQVSLNNRDWTTLMEIQQDTNLTWNQRIIPLDSYIDKRFYFRFVIATDSSNTADGWWIDDFEIRNHPSAEIQPDWCDNTEIGGGQWIPGGTWAIVRGVDDNPVMENQDPIVRPIRPHSAYQFWSDSPGSNYQHATNSSLQLSPAVNLTASSNPELVFWHQWDMAANDHLYIDISTDGGETWPEDQIAWEKIYNQKPAGYGTSSVDSTWYNTELLWTREVVSLQQWAGQKINIRFRLNAMSDTSTSDGWWIDDVCFQEHKDDPVRPLPFYDSFDAGSGNWIVAGSWTNSDPDAQPRDGSAAFSDSPGDYGNQTNGILELNGVLDLTGAQNPTLYFWDRFELAWGDQTIVEVKVSEDNGTTWGPWNEIHNIRYEKTASWNRRQIKVADLSSYSGYLVKLRFRLMTSQGDSPADGWYVDNLAVVSRVGENVHPVPFLETGENLNDFWVMEGTWDRIGMSRGSDTPYDLGPGGWTGEYYDDSDSCGHTFENATLAGTRTDTDIDFDFDPSANQPYGMANCFLVRWTRQVNIPADNTALEFQTYSDDGIRVAVDPPGVPDPDGNYVTEWDWLIDKWVNRGMPSSPDRGGIVLNAGVHTIVVEYYENYGSADVLLEVVETGSVFHDSPAGSYNRFDNASMMLEGMIDLTDPTLEDPVLTYYERYNLGSNHYARTEVSTDGGYTWIQLKAQGGTNWSWTQRVLSLDAYRGKMINIRFRLDARQNTTPREGWWIDDIRVFDM